MDIEIKILLALGVLEVIGMTLILILCREKGDGGKIPKPPQHLKPTKHSEVAPPKSEYVRSW